MLRLFRPNDGPSVWREHGEGILSGLLLEQVGTALKTISYGPTWNVPAGLTLSDELPTYTV